MHGVDEASGEQPMHCRNLPFAWRMGVTSFGCIGIRDLLLRSAQRRPARAIWFSGSAHNVPFEEPARFRRCRERLSPVALIHGGDKEVLEGNWSSDLIVIEFPDLDRARAWYASPAYQEIVPLRRDNADGAVILMEGVGEDHVATDILS